MAFDRPQRLPYREPASLWIRFKRLLRYRLIIPIMRSRHSPEHTARGIMVGLAWAFTPTVGIQMILVLGTWVVTRRLFKWDFSLVQGAAWTWTTNVFTALPCYYVFFVTGQLMLGRWHDLSGYESFLTLFNASFTAGQSTWEQAKTVVAIVFLDWGLAMWVGSLPWAVLMGWLGYVLGLRFVRRYRQVRAERMTRRIANQGKSAPVS
jgi:uncharacterized protein (DUF2062 family)